MLQIRKFNSMQAIKRPVQIQNSFEIAKKSLNYVPIAISFLKPSLNMT